MKTPALICALLAVHAAAHAERADTFKETRITARHSVADLITREVRLTGDVELRRGTLLIKADKGVLTENARGYQHLVLSTNKGGKPVFFRQKRDGGGEQWMEGEALRAEYDGETELLDLILDAKARRSTGGQLTDEVSGEHISYVARDERYVVSQLPDSGPSGDRGGDRRGTMVLQPVRKDPLLMPASSAAAAAASAPGQ
ncbi:lipopolysaccharide transport periplasmic protein LptA [Duganella aceris]|uniref:Lipopolysaccharide transport periplasmic protein LptA n=1 Tax=Duganella aceris TaxID=2703883 RepID=A0ABX0FTD5_9BURK|nr:lipopolysaccharide transport periplasmic protein LptA [Duganella aceris]NGZ87800.1 lipopolysaccharide transport periplasmic protein LptA [Duganella aceris]